MLLYETLPAEQANLVTIDSKKKKNISEIL